MKGQIEMANKNELKIKKVKLVACKDGPNFFECPNCHKVYDNAMGWDYEKDGDTKIVYCKCGALIECPKTIEIEYKGYMVGQSDYNYHTYISKDNKLITHLQTHKRLNEKQLQKVLDNFLSVCETLERTK